MATQSNALIGWDLIYRLVEDSINQNSDLVIALIHWCLIVKGYRCLGVGSDKTLLENEESSELLPAGWNDSEIYSLRYKLNDELYILHAVKSDNIFFANFLQVKSLNVTNITINLDETVKELNGPLNVMIPDSQELLSRIRLQLIEAHGIATKKEVETQTTPRSSNRQSARSRGPLVLDYRRRVYPDLDQNIGRGDLDPLGRGGGGMIFDLAPGHLHANEFDLIPPGARFNPFNPLRPDVLRGDPDDDHLPPPRPPRYNNDDMYM